MATAAASRQQVVQTCVSQAQGGRYNGGDQEEATLSAVQQARRPSFRGAGYESTVAPMSPDSGGPPSTSLGIEDDRRSRRRSSQLSDLSGRALPQPPHGGSGSRSGGPPRHMDELRQGSVAGEDIKIVIHDVDSEANFNSRPGAKRRVVLRRDPSDKAHRTRGFGMRVVGGKTGNDGRLFAYIVWTVPGGPAEKGGLQQGDKVLEWDGVPLTDRSFEEVCAVMDRAGEVVELVVEHATDLRMCDLLDEPSALMTASRKASENLGMQLESDEKAPTSPTRRKLPKTPV